jgi:hypothetical protein
MESLRNLLTHKGYHVVSYRDFCINKQNNETTVNKRIQELQIAIENKFVVFIDWEHERVLKTLVSYNFVGFEKILESHYNTNKWAISVPTFGHDNFAPRQVNNLDFLIYVNKFNIDFDANKIDHSCKIKDFLYLNGKPHLFRVQLLKELLHKNLLQNSVWSAGTPSQGWNDMERKLPAEYEWPEFRGKLVNGYHDRTRQIYHPMYNDTICSIVPETLTDNDCHYITEKTAKPIMAEHLFVILSGAGFLQNLRDLGFKTFHEHFDESYDDCVNLHERVIKIAETLKQIRDMDHGKLYEDTKQTRRHNRELFFSEDFYKEFNTVQLRKLEKYFPSQP